MFPRNNGNSVGVQNSSIRQQAKQSATPVRANATYIPTPTSVRSAAQISRRFAIGSDETESGGWKWSFRQTAHGISGAGADGLFGGGASPAGPDFKRHAAEPAALVAGCGSGRHEPYRRRSDRRHGQADLARLGASLQ